MTKAAVTTVIGDNFANIKEFAKVVHSVDVADFALEDDYNNCCLLDETGETVMRFRMYGTMDRVRINVYVGDMPERCGIYQHVLGEPVVKFEQTETPIVGDFVWYDDEASNRFIKNTKTGETIAAPLCDFRGMVAAIRFAAGVK